MVSKGHNYGDKCREKEMNKVSWGDIMWNNWKGRKKSDLKG